jgi:hypothetical protein
MNRRVDVPGSAVNKSLTVCGNGAMTSMECRSFSTENVGFLQVKVVEGNGGLVRESEVGKEEKRSR